MSTSSSYVLDLVMELSDALQTTVVGKPLPPAKTEAEERQQTIALFTATMVIATIHKKYNIVALCKAALNKITEATKLGKKNSHKVGVNFWRTSQEKTVQKKNEKTEKKKSERQGWLGF